MTGFGWPHRRGSATALRVALALAALVASTLAHAAAERPAVAVAVGPIGMTVSDLGRSVAFYSRVLGFEPVFEERRDGKAFADLHGVAGARARAARLRLGDEEIELTEYQAPRGAPLAADSRSNDRWFQHVAVIVRDMDEAYAWLVANGVRHVSPAPQRLPDWNPRAGGIRAFYFQDPDGHVLEVLQFPPGKGSARWHAPTDRLFLGIDHTAIVVADTAASLRFYRDALGLRLAGESENHGPEQERLNAVPGAHLRISTLRAARGPGIELLEYLAPRDGRATPGTLRASDVAHWQTRLVVRDLRAAERDARAAGATVVSAEGEIVSGAEPGLPGALLVRDGDGHALLLAAQGESRP